MANNLFGHNSSYHQLPTNKDIVKELFNLNIGDQVTFTYEDKKLVGTIYKINKRATVMVQDRNGTYADKQGNRYIKYYVPLNRINL